MALRQWEENRWLKKEPTSKQEIHNLLEIVNRDTDDAAVHISFDWRFGIAYNAALKLCTVLLRAEGYRPAHGLHHYRTIMAMPLILGDARKNDAQYLDACRVKRNTAEYDYVGGVSEQDAVELLEFVRDFRHTVLEWLKNNHPEYS